MSPEYCVSNIDEETRMVFEKSDLEFRESYCLDHCHECYNSAFLAIDGDLIQGKDHATVLNKLAEDR